LAFLGILETMWFHLAGKRWDADEKDSFMPKRTKQSTSERQSGRFYRSEQ
jgi:hypothetical protein